MPLNFEGFDALFRPRRPHREFTTCIVCGQITREGKPYCADHIHKLDYAASIQSKNTDMEAELDLVAQRGPAAIKKDSPVVAQIINTLAVEDGLEARKLAWESDVPPDLIIFYLAQMALWDIVEVVPEKDSSQIVFLKQEPSSRQPLLTTTELARKLGMDPVSIRRSVDKGAPYTIVGKKKYFDPDIYLRWKKEHHHRLGQQFNERGRIAKLTKIEDFRNRVSQETQKPLSTATEIAQAMDVSPLTVKFWVTRGLPNYQMEERVVGKGRIRLFNLQEVQDWYADFKHKDSEARKQKTKSNWQQVYQDAMEHGIEYAAQKHNYNKTVIRRKLKEMGAPRVQPKTGSTRTYSVTDAAKEIGIKPVTVFKWIYRFGAPHDRIKMAHLKRPRVLVDPQELKEWYQQRNTKKKGRKKTIKRRIRR